ncbi:MAG: hypothetical protein ACF8XB_00380 [Planctomycetota bacterium JB042]
MTGGARATARIVAAALALPFLFPFVWLGALAARAAVSRDDGVVAAAFAAWTDPASLATVPAALVAGLLAAALGLGLGAFLDGVKTTGGRVLAGLSMLPLATPPVFLGGVVADLTGLGPAPMGGAAALARWGGLVCVQALAFAPVAALATWAALRAIPDAERKAARLLRSRREAWRLSIGPAVRRPLVLTVAAVFALAATDVAVPPHFGVETLASRVAQGFLLSLDAERSAAAAWPLWAALAVAVAVALAGAPRATGAGGRRIAVVPPARGPAFLTLAYVAVAVAAPFAHALAHAGLDEGGLAVFGKFGDELGATLATVGLGLALGAGAAAACVAVGAAGGGVGTRTAAGRFALRLALAIPFCAPGVWVGVAAVDAAARAGATVTVPVVAAALLLRVLPWAAIGALVVGRSAAVRAARAAGVPAARRASLAARGEASGPMAAAAIAVAAAAAREVDLYAACAVPETETLALRAADALHYGFVADAARPIALQQAALVAATLLLAVGARSFVARRRRAFEASGGIDVAR